MPLGFYQLHLFLPTPFNAIDASTFPLPFSLAHYRFAVQAGGERDSGEHGQSDGLVICSVHFSYCGFMLSLSNCRRKSGRMRRWRQYMTDLTAKPRENKLTLAEW